MPTLPDDAPLPPTGRYAPSPTGALHLGNLRTALAAWASARAAGGRLLVRIEDIDRARSRPEFEERQLEDLRLLGIDWDEAPVRQSERAPLYEAALSQLRRDGWLYPCFCSRRDLRESASAPHDGEEPPYPGNCRNLDPGEARRRIDSGAPHCERLRVEMSPILFSDRFDPCPQVDLRRNGGDFVVKRADGGYAYQLACAVDDAGQGITEVLRGADLLASAQRQKWILSCLGRRAPEYFHLPLLLGEHGRRLSKRDGADDLRAWAVQGFDATAVRSYLAYTLGMVALGERVEPSVLPARWDPSRIPANAVTLQPAEMRAFLG